MKEILYFAFAGIVVCGFPVLVMHFIEFYCEGCGMPAKHCLCKMVDSTYAGFEEEDDTAA